MGSNVSWPSANQNRVTGLSDSENARVQTPSAQETDGTVELNGVLRFRNLCHFLDAATAPKVVLSPESREYLVQTRPEVEALVTMSEDPIYGGNTDLGNNSHIGVLADPAAQRAKQKELLIRHDAGYDAENRAPLGIDVVRLALLIRANAMARGEIGVRPEVAERFLALLNAGITPLVPENGSLGNGDLTQMARIGRAAIGMDVPVRFGDRVGPASEILPLAGLEPFDLEMIEAIGIMSGSTVVAAELTIALKKAKDLFDLADATMALFLEASNANVGRMEWIKDSSPRSEQKVAQNVWGLVKNSKRCTANGRVQEAFSVRTSLRLHSEARHYLKNAIKKLNRELKITPSNPQFIRKPDGTLDYMLSGSSSAEPLGLAANFLNETIVKLASQSRQRSKLLLNDPQLNLNDGVLQSTSKAILAQMNANATPIARSDDQDDTKSDIEDVASLAPTSVQNLSKNIDALMDVLCIEMLMATHAISGEPDKLSEGSAKLAQHLSALMAAVGPEGSPYDYREAIAQDFRSGKLSAFLRGLQEQLNSPNDTSSEIPNATPSAQYVREARWTFAEPTPPAEPSLVPVPSSASEWSDFKDLDLFRVPKDLTVLGRDLYWIEDDPFSRSDTLHSYRPVQNESTDTYLLHTGSQIAPMKDRLLIASHYSSNPQTFIRGQYDKYYRDTISWDGVPSIERYNIAFCEAPKEQEQDSNGGVYAIGGDRMAWGDSPTQNFQRLDETRRQWIDLPPLKIPRAGAKAFHVGGFIYVIGGPPEPNRVDVFNIRENKWENHFLLKHDWNQVSAWVEDDSRIVIASGVTSAGEPISEVEVIDLSDPLKPKTQTGRGFGGLEDAEPDVKIMKSSRGIIAVGKFGSKVLAKCWVPPES